MQILPYLTYMSTSPDSLLQGASREFLLRCCSLSRTLCLAYAKGAVFSCSIHSRLQQTTCPLEALYRKSASVQPHYAPTILILLSFYPHSTQLHPMLSKLQLKPFQQSSNHILRHFFLLLQTFLTKPIPAHSGPLQPTFYSFQTPFLSYSNSF